MTENGEKKTGLPLKVLNALKAIPKKELAKKLAAHAGMAAFFLILVIFLAAIVWGRPFVTRKIAEHRERKAMLPHKYMEYATNVLIKAEQYDEAFTYMQAAIDKMTLPEERAEAGLVIADFLLDRARMEPEPYARMAKGYVVSSLNIEHRPEQKIKMYKIFAKAAVLLRDWQTAMEVCEQAESIAETDDDKAYFLHGQLDVLLRMQAGTWERFDEVWNRAAPFMDQNGWVNRFRMMKLRLYERVLTNNDWYQSWLADQTEISDPITARTALLRKMLALCDGLAGDTPEAAEEALFMAIRLCVAENRFSEATYRIRDYFEKDYRKHQEEILLLLIRMARLEGKQQRSEDLITQFLRRYRWFARATEELLAVIAQAESVGHYQEALDILAEYLKNPEAQDELARLHYKAGELAQKLQLYDKALEHYGKTLENYPDETLFVSTLISRSEIYMDQGEYGEAQSILTRVLTGLPFDPARGAALYRLIDEFMRSEALLSDRILVTSLAVDVMKNDPRVVTLLMELARSYEELGLFSDAHDYYTRATLLRTVDAAGRERTPDSQNIMESLLGSARCLVEIGDYARADRLLRDLCYNAEAGKIFSQAAYLWASIAFRANQYQQAERRLALIDTAKAPPELAVKVNLDRLLLDVAANRKTPNEAVNFLDGYTMLTDMEKLEFTGRAYRICFERMLKDRDVAGMQEFIDTLASDVAGLPVGRWVMELASVVMEDMGTAEFIQCLERNARHIRAPVDDNGIDIAELREIAKSVDEMTKKVNEYTR